MSKIIIDRPAGRYGPRTQRQEILENSEAIPGTLPKLDEFKHRYVRQTLLTRFEGRLYFTDWVQQYLKAEGGWEFHDGLFTRTPWNDLGGITGAARDRILIMLASYPTKAEGVAALNELVDGITDAQVSRVKILVRSLLDGC